MCALHVSQQCLYENCPQQSHWKGYETPKLIKLTFLYLRNFAPILLSLQLSITGRPTSVHRFESTKLIESEFNEY